MSALPDELPGDHERRYWNNGKFNAPGNVEISSLEQLISAHPRGKDIQQIEKKEGYAIYGIHRSFAYIAYSCDSCESFIVGAPRIKGDTSIEANELLVGRRGYDVYCKNCNSHLEGVTFEMS